MGQTHPQKARPRTKVAATTISAGQKTVRTAREATDAVMASNGLNRGNKSTGYASFKG
jgi:hypothetical protein